MRLAIRDFPATPFLCWRVMHRKTVIVLLICLAYQLGACPCGCLEHNAWLQILGLSHHDHGPAGSPDQSVVAAAEHHDCSGQPRPLYLTNTDRHETSVSVSVAFVEVPRRPLSSSLESGMWPDHRGPPRFCSRRARLTALQVFLL